MKKTALHILLTALLLMGLSACEKIKDELGLSSKSIKSDINPDLFEDEQLINCVAQLTQGLLAAEVQDIFCPGQGISSLKGLEQFPNLRSLFVNQSRLTEVDLSPFPKLEIIDFSASELEHVDLSHNPELVQAILDLNRTMDSLDVSKNTKLEKLVLSGNNFSSLDVSQNPMLEELVLDSNAFVGDMRLGALDLSNNEKLINLNLFNNDITHIDLSRNVNLDFLDIRDNDLFSINLLSNTNLTDLRLNNNNLTSIDLLNANNLDTLLLENNQIQTINLPINGKLRFAFLRDNMISCDPPFLCNGLSRFRIPSNPTFIHLDLSNNQLETSDIDLRDNQFFTELLLSGNSNMYGTFELLDEARELVELGLDDTNIQSLDFGLYITPTDIFNNYDIQVIDATGADLDLDSKKLLDDMEAIKHLHPRFDPAVLKYVH